MEKKYLLSGKQYDALMEGLADKVEADEYGRHTIRNIYLDTDDYRLIRTSLEKPVYKEKLRLRSYGKPQGTDQVFIELKKKYCGVVYKRRAAMEYTAARKYLYEGQCPDKDSQILREIDYARELYAAKPAVFIAYDRMAYFVTAQPEVRITFDTNIRGRRGALELETDGGEHLIMEPEQYLMEIKIPGCMPGWLSRLLSELRIYPASYSKYGVYYQRFIMPQTKGYRGGKCFA